MTTTIPDLWSDDIRVDVLTPLVILQSQEGFLEQKTQGILRADVATTTSGPLVQHQLDIVAPALKQYRKTLVTAKHHKDMVYPVTVRAESFLPEETGVPAPIGVPFPLEPPPDQREANTQDEFVDLVRQVFQSGRVKAMIQSLIARSNEVRARERAMRTLTNPGAPEVGNPGGSSQT